ncbi:alpha/beta hydrolase [Arthrobacter sp. Br18]|uniref:alpha/beta hydrolase n=1 Tax=Arthrobacter sp. Br18 TaxID=1312954 RepID=UPI00047B8973|nr:alpha/beta hydrolase [Arthrobacter sp. Br18]
MTDHQEWPHVFEPGSADEPVLLLLHGTGGSEHDLLPLAARLAPRAGVLSPRGPVQENGSNRWFHRIAEGVFDVDDVIRRAGELASFLAWARETYGLGDRQVIAVGFSNGANMGLAAVLLHPQALAGVIAFSGMYPLKGRTVDADLSAIDVALFNGDADPMAPLDSVEQLAAVLESRGARLTRSVSTGGHGVHPSDISGAVSWLVDRSRRVDS